MKLTKSINVALATALFLNSAMPAFAFDDRDEGPQAISWSARAGHWFGMKTEDYAAQKAEIIAKQASSKVRTALHGIFFGDGDRYGIDADGRRVNIFTNKSNLLNNLFKSVTGTDLDDTLKSVLPLGSLYVNKLRQMMDSMIVNKVLASVVSFGVEEMIYRAVMSSYNLATSKVNELTSTFLASLKKQPKSESARALEETFNKVKNAKLDDVKETEEGDKDVKAAAAKILDQEDESSELTLSNVMSYYKNKFLSYVDGVLKDTAISGIAYAAKKLGQNISDTTINWVKGSTTMSGAFAALFVNPIAGVGAMVTGMMSHMYQKEIGNVIANSAESKARERATSALSSKQFVAHKNPDFASTTETFDDEDFEVLSEVDHSITAWATQKFAKAQSIVKTAKDMATKAISTVKTVTTHIKQTVENAEWAEGTKAATQELNRMYGGYNPTDIQSLMRPYTAEELEIRQTAEKTVLHPLEDPKSNFYRMSESHVEALTGSIGEAYDDAVDAWEDDLDVEVKRLTRVKKAQTEQKPSSLLTTITSFFGW
ncbi:MAG: hypothetical protein K2X53_06250 [Alphaproteobacteria bacterium]|nr:hypothetical protein [Alphaproteobacteria bacterium]